MCNFWNGAAGGWPALSFIVPVTKKGTSRLSSISAGGDGDVWATSTTQVDSHGYAVLHWDRTLQGWTQMTGSLKQVASGSQAIIWGVDLLQNVWKYNTTTSTWTQMYGQATQITAAKDGTVWKLDSGGVAARFNAAGNGGNCAASAGAPAAACWTAVAGTASQISVGSAKTFWAIGNYSGSYNTYYFPSRKVVLTAGIQGYTSCGCPPGMMHTFNVSAQFTGQTPVTKTQQATPPTNVNVFVTNGLYSPGCDPFIDVVEPGCQWAAQEGYACTQMVNTMTHSGGGGLGWPWISNVIPIAAIAGDTHVPVTIYGASFVDGFMTVSVVDADGNPAPITVVSQKVVTSTEIDAVFSIPASVSPGDYGVTVKDSLLPDGGLPSSNVWPFTVYPPVTPQIMFGGQNIAGQTQTVVVGQQIALSSSYSMPPGTGVTVSSRSWTVSGTTVGGLDTTNIVGGPLPTNLTADSTTFYWTSAGTSLNVTFTLRLSNGNSPSASATFNVAGPSAVGVNVQTGQVQIIAGPQLSFGNASGVTGMNLTASATPPSGYSNHFVWEQLIGGDTLVYTDSSGAVSTCHPLTQPIQNRFPGLDTTYPYVTGSAAQDSPGAGLGSPYKEVTRNFSATMFLMWSSELPNSIPVPLGSVAWHFSGDAKLTNAQTNQWSLVSGSGSASSFAPSSSYASWINWVDYAGGMTCP